MIMKSVGKWFNRSIDFSDIIGLGGLGLIFYGFYLWKPFMAYIVTGFLVLVFAVVANLGSAEPKGKG